MIQLGYPKEFFYKDNYNRSNLKWFKLEQILESKPKYIALIEQNLDLNGKNIDYKFVYSSKHNFFKFVTKKEEKKNSFVKKVISFNKKISIPADINDDDLSENNFIERVLDHCKYASTKNIKERDRKTKLKFKNFGECKLKYVNYKDYDDLTLKKFTNDTTVSSTKNNSTKKEMVKKKDTSVKEISKNFNTVNLSLYWENLPYLAIVSLQMNSKDSGVLKLDLHQTKDKCVGTVAINRNNRGSWSLICPDNKKRAKGFKKNLSANGTLKIKSKNFVEGKGSDVNNNKIEFIAKKNIYE